MDLSMLTVMWFQDNYAFPIDEGALAVIVGVDWGRLARDGAW